MSAIGASAPVDVRCPVCLRREIWRDGDVEVVQPGGARQPAEPAAIAAWRTLLAARRGESDPVVGACAACGHPVLGRGVPLPSFTVDTPGGVLQVGDEILGPAGPIPEQAVETWIRAHLPRDPGGAAGKAIFVGFAVVMVGVVLLGWLWAAHFVAFFIWVGVPNGALELR